MHLITAVKVENYKNVRDIAITPSADAHLIVIGGKNKQGKSSLLDALSAAFGGAKQVAGDPVRHGEKEAAIFVELDGGKLTIDRVIAPDGTTTLEVRDEEGAVRKPQDLLNKLLGARMLDPLGFLGLPAKEQRAALMKVIPDAARIEELDTKRRRAFDRRTELGRDLTKAEGEFARLPEVTEIPAAIDVAALAGGLTARAAQASKLSEVKAELAKAEQRAGDALAKHNDAAAKVADIEAQVRALADKLLAARGDLVTAMTAIETTTHEESAAKEKAELFIGAWSEGQAERDRIDADLARADAVNRTAHEATSAAWRREQAAAAIVKLKSDTADCTKALTTIDERKAAILEAAALPVAGLAITDDGITLAGVPFAQASGAEKFRVALALACAASPGLSDVWIRDAALLDDESLALVEKHAIETGRRVWIERVGTKDPGVIVISDGQVAS